MDSNPFATGGPAWGCHLLDSNPFATGGLAWGCHLLDSNPFCHWWPRLGMPFAGFKSFLPLVAPPGDAICWIQILFATGRPAWGCHLLDSNPFCHWSPRLGMPFAGFKSFLPLVAPPGDAICWIQILFATGRPAWGCHLLDSNPFCHWSPRLGMPFAGFKSFLPLVAPPGGVICMKRPYFAPGNCRNSSDLKVCPELRLR